MKHRTFLSILLICFLIILIRPDPIPINSDDYWVFDIVRDMVEHPSYFSLSGSGYRIMHKLIYLPVFLWYHFDVMNLAFATTLVTVFFDVLLFVGSYLLFKRIFNYRVASIVVFFISISHMIIRTTWYWSSTHLNIGTAFFVISFYFLTRSDAHKDYFLASLFCFLAIFTRETFIIMLAPLFFVSLFARKHTKSFTHCMIATWPFLLYALYILLNIHYLGTIINQTFAGFVHPSLANISNMHDYFAYITKTLLVLPILTAVILFFYQKKEHTQPTFVQLSMSVWFLSGIGVLLLTSNTDPRYIIPILPVIFAFTAKILDDVLFSKYEPLFTGLTNVILGNMFFWVLLFNGDYVHTVFNISYLTLTTVYNMILYGIISYALLSPRYYLQHYVPRPRRETMLAAFIFFSFTATAFAQLGLTYSFYLWTYNHTDSMNHAIAFLAQQSPQGSFVVGNPTNPTTSFDEYWFRAFHREDLHAVHVTTPDVPTNFTNTSFYISTPTSTIDVDVITPFVQHNKEQFIFVARFGAEEQKKPLIRIPNNPSKALTQLFSTGKLFKLEPGQGFMTFIFKKK